MEDDNKIKLSCLRRAKNDDGEFEEVGYIVFLKMDEIACLYESRGSIAVSTMQGKVHRLSADFDVDSIGL